MTEWIVFTGEDHEGGSIEGVYFSLDEALLAFEKTELWGCEYVILFETGKELVDDEFLRKIPGLKKIKEKHG